MLRIFLFLLGFGISTIGFSYIIMYLNYLTIGYSIIDYINIIIKRWECLLAPIGIILLGISIIKE